MMVSQFSMDTVISLLLNGRAASGQDLKSSEGFFFFFPGGWADDLSSIH